jgi:hypothetical protein
VDPRSGGNSQVLSPNRARRTVRDMLRVLRPGRRPSAPDAVRVGPLPPAVEARVRLSADLLAALLEVERRHRATLDDLEWADAVADRIVRRRAARRHIEASTFPHAGTITER